MPDEIAQKNTQTFSVIYEKDGVYLTVFRSVDFLNRANETDVLNLIRKKRIHNYNASIISDAVKRADGNPVKIADAQEEARIDAAIEAIVSADKMKAYVVLTSPEGGGAVPTVEGIVQALYSKGVVFGMSEEKIRLLAANPVYDMQVLVAEGIPAQNGKSGEVKYLIDIKKDRKPVIMEDGSVNYKDLNLIENITKGQKLAELVPPVQGKSGRNLVGAELKAIDGRPAVLPKGRNVTLSPDGQELISEIDGQVMFADGKISVFSTYEVKADVDNSTGNIKFIGNVVVRGNVLAGFEIEAGGNIEVNGVVEGAVLKAGGNIVLKRGMVGGGKGLLIAGGDIISKYIESTNVEARGDIKAEAIMHCDVKCANKMELGGRKGLLVGGTARVGKLVELKFCGSQMATVTVL
ncbi:MAG: FapA family protein, partial [Clostridia bacterium]|nr:FapA family protein [Clostridia bacterium]